MSLRGPPRPSAVPPLSLHCPSVVPALSLRGPFAVPPWSVRSPSMALRGPSATCRCRSAWNQVVHLLSAPPAPASPSPPSSLLCPLLWGLPLRPPLCFAGLSLVCFISWFFIQSDHLQWMHLACWLLLDFCHLDLSFLVTLLSCPFLGVFSNLQNFFFFLFSLVGWKLKHFIYFLLVDSEKLRPLMSPLPPSQGRGCPLHGALGGTPSPSGKGVWSGQELTWASGGGTQRAGKAVIPDSNFKFSPGWDGAGVG